MCDTILPVVFRCMNPNRYVIILEIGTFRGWACIRIYTSATNCVFEDTGNP